MRLNEKCYAVVDANGVMIDYGYADLARAENWRDYYQKNGRDCRVVACVLVEAGEWQRVISQMHHRENHPDYEYGTCCFTPNATDNMIKPDGEGWEPNNYATRNGTKLEIHRGTEFRFWMRRKPAALARPANGEGQQ